MWLYLLPDIATFTDSSAGAHRHVRVMPVDAMDRECMCTAAGAYDGCPCVDVGIQWGTHMMYAKAAAVPASIITTPIIATRP